MKYLVAFAALVSVSGCANTTYTPTVLEGSAHTYGYQDYDPCVRCGEGWIFLNIDDTQHLKD